MIVEYRFSSPEGDIPLSSEDLNKSFKITLQKEHPVLTLGDYFKVLQEFILAHNRDYLTDLIGATGIEKLIIRSEKHGALYHIASIDLFHGEETKRFALCSAVTETGRNSLRHEFEIITNLNRETNLHYLPRTYCLTDIISSYDDKMPPILVTLMEWFEDYHEWHLQEDESSRQQRLIIWDQQNGYRFASDYEAREIYKQAAKIITLYYDFTSHRHIHPWHHAAGDFIVKTKDKIELKLTTARGYDSIMDHWGADNIIPMTAAVYFFLNLTVRMRLDRQDGTGKLLWADERFINPVIDGFLESWVMKGNEEMELSDELKKLPDLLKSFSSDELEKLLYSLLPIYEKEDSEEFAIIKNNLPQHALDLYKSLKSNTGPILE